MSDTRRVSLVLTVPAAVAAVAALAGCGGSSSQPASEASKAAPAGMVATDKAGVASPARLREALLARVNGAPAATPAESGDYSELPEVKATRSSLKGVIVSPPRCAEAAVAGFNSATFSHAPAAVVTFRVGRNGVSEVLVDRPQVSASELLGNEIPAGCEHYSAEVDGKTFDYSVRQSTVHGIGQQGRMLSVKTVGYSQVNIWSVVYSWSGYLGAVTVVGPDASASAVRQLGAEAYGYASRRLAS